jgi:transcriptional regulator with XRE-family HTH domain
MHPIARHRKANGWTQTELAERTGVTLSSVQNWEAGKGPRPRNLPKLAEVLGIDARALLDEIEALKAR